MEEGIPSSITHPKQSRCKNTQNQHFDYVLIINSSPQLKWFWQVNSFKKNLCKELDALKISHVKIPTPSYSHHFYFSILQRIDFEDQKKVINKLSQSLETSPHLLSIAEGWKNGQKKLETIPCPLSQEVISISTLPNEIICMVFAKYADSSIMCLKTNTLGTKVKSPASFRLTPKKILLHGKDLALLSKVCRHWYQILVEKIAALRILYKQVYTPNTTSLFYAQVHLDALQKKNSKKFKRSPCFQINL